MKDFKELVKESYKEYEADDLRAKRLENQILFSIENLEKKKKPPYVRWLTAAASVVVIASTFYMTQFGNLFEYKPIEDNMNAIAQELNENPELLSQTTMAYGSPDDIYYQRAKTKAKELDASEIRRIMKDI